MREVKKTTEQYTAWWGRGPTYRTLLGQPAKYVWNLMIGC